MSGPRDRIGLLLPLPALLAVGAASVDAREPAAPPERPDPAEPEPAATEPGLHDTELPPELRPEARAAFERGEQAFARGEHHEAASAFERAAELAPELVVLRLDVVIALQHAILTEPDPEAATELCARLQRDAERVAEHPRATPEMIERARAEQARAHERCAALEPGDAGPRPSVVGFEPCLVAAPITEPSHGPCLVPPYDPEPGCAHRHDTAMLGVPLLLLGLRARRRRDALERMADRLPPDVVARLRRETDAPEP